MIFFLLFYTFFEIGLFTFGGGYAMIPLIQDQVIAHGWASLSTLVDFIAISESTPGPFAINIATFIGNDVGGIFGAVATTIGVVTPSFLVILLIAKYFRKIQHNPNVQAALSGLRPAVVGLIASATFSVLIYTVFGQKELLDIQFTQIDIKAIAIFVVVLCISLFVKKKHPIMLILISMTLGIILYGLI